MTNLLTFNAFCLTIPSDWKYESNEENITSIYDAKGGFGAITVTHYNIPKVYNFNLFDELFDFASEYIIIDKDKFKAFQNTTEVKNGIIIDKIMIQNREWLFAIFFYKQQCLLITYNSTVSDYLKEAPIINKIISSIETI